MVSPVVDDACRIAERCANTEDIEGLRESLSLLAECLRADEGIVAPYLPRMTALVSMVCAEPKRFSRALEDVTLLLRNGVLHLDMTVLPAWLQAGPALHSLPLLRLPPSMADMALDFVSAVAQRMGPQATAFLEGMEVMPPMIQVLLGGESPLLRNAINNTLQSIILADPDPAGPFLTMLRSTPGLQGTLEEYAAQEPAYRWLASVVAGTDPLTTDLVYDNWIDMAGLHRSLIQSK